MVRFRIGAGVKACRYCIEEQKQLCKVYGYEGKSWAQVLEVCTGEDEECRSVNDCVREVLDENGQGLRWMKRLKELKGRKGRKAR